MIPFYKLLLAEVRLNIAEFQAIVYFRTLKLSNPYILITIVITLCLLTTCSNISEPDNSAPVAQKPSITDTLAQADQLFRQREDVEKLREARRLTGQLRDPDNRNFDVESRYAKYSLFLGQRLTEEKDREKVFEEGRDAAKIASRLRPDQPDGYFWYGANLGELSQMSPVTVGYKSIDDIRQAMNKVIELQPGFQGASAYDILAQLELNTHLFGGKDEKAAEYLEKAIEIQKNNSNLRLHLAQAYLGFHKEPLAKQQLEYIIKMQPDPDYIPEHKANVEQAKKLLASRF